MANNQLSLSISLDVPLSSSPTDNYDPRKAKNWLDDSMVSACHGCDRNFNTFLRRHHCRLCGRIFCYYCSNHAATIPDQLLSDDSRRGTWSSYLTSYTHSQNTTKHRVCTKCHDFVMRIEQVQELIEIFKLCNFDIPTIKRASRTCKVWNCAANYLISLFREIQYKIPGDTYSDLEKQMLWRNAPYLSGHNRYVFHLLKICRTESDYVTAIEFIKKPKTITCHSLMCCRNCQPELTSMDGINLLTYSYETVGRNDVLRSLAFRTLDCPDDLFRCYLPILVHYVRYDDCFLSNYLLDRCTGNIQLLNALYWELHVYPKDEYHTEAYGAMLTRFKQIFSSDENKHKFVTLLQAHSLINVFTAISKNVCDDKLRYDDIKDSFTLRRDVVSPFNPHITIQHIQVDKIKIKSSATKPILIPCTTSTGNTINFLHKKENLRKDQIVTSIIRLADHILKKEENLDLDVISYDVLPTGRNEGLIEVIPDCETLYFIQQKINSSILNYILEHNKNTTINEVRSKFIRSTAFYCVISYLLGIGDRHLDNIMVTKDGRFFHIDFGYILGEDPVFRNPGIRITPEIVDAIGGLSSQYYVQFTDYCTRIYNCLRRNINIFITIIQILPRIAPVNTTEDNIRRLLVNRFIPRESNVNAKLHLTKKLSETSYSYTIKDWCHYHSKEKTINSAMSRLTNAISNLWSLNNSSNDMTTNKNGYI